MTDKTQVAETQHENAALLPPVDVIEDANGITLYADLPRYRRAFTLSKELDSEKVSAEFRDGVLKLRIPKAAHAQARKIAIQAA